MNCQCGGTLWKHSVGTTKNPGIRYRCSLCRKTVTIFEGHTRPTGRPVTKDLRRKQWTGIYQPMKA